jgi:ammonia channel protein AmtB
VFNRTGRINTTDNLWAFNGAPYNQLYSSSTNWSLFYGSVLNTTIPLSTAQKLISQNYDNVTTYIYDNSTLNSQANTNFTITNLALNVFGFFAFNYGSQGNLQEFIIYTTNQTTSRAAIETEIKNFYGI